MNRLRYIIAILSLLVTVTQSYGQVDRRDVRQGNRDFKKENYREADIDYRKALVKDSLSVAANYNLANNLYRQKDMEQAKAALERIGEIAPEIEQAADYYFNLGDVAVAQQDWQGAVDAFEQSLLRNPGDMDAKENYIYAKQMLQNQQQNQNQQQQNQDQNQDQQNQNDQNDNQSDENDQDDKDKDNKNDQNDQNPDDQKDQDGDQKKDQQKPQQNQGQQPKITPQAAQQMLQAIQAKEKETQEKVNKERAEALKSRQKEKNW